MASKSGQESASTEQIEELLDTVDSTLDRLKTLYEQYFLGIQKQAPGFIHSDVERKLRELTQLNIRNTGLRYRLATLQQKFGSYNSYWRRTLRQIENGTYTRNLAKIGREAARTGSDIPEEILAAMPKRMREQVLRDRDQALAIAKRRQQLEDAAAADAAGLADGDAAFIHDESVQLDDAPARRVETKKTASGAHVISEDDGDIDFNALFSAFDDDAPSASTLRGKSPTAQPRNKPGTLQPASRPQLPRMPVPNTTQPPLGAATPAAPGTPPRGSPTPPAGSPSVPAGPLHATGPIPIATSPASQTSAIPRPAVPSAPPVPPAAARAPGTHQPGQTQAVPRAVGQQPSGPHGAPRPPATHQTGPVQAVPRAAGQQPSGPHGAPRPPATHQTGPVQAVPRAAGQQPSGPTQGIPRPVGQQASGPTQGIPHPIDQQPSPPSGAVVRPPGVVPPTARTGPVPVAQRQTGPVPTVTQPIPRPVSPTSPHAAPSQQARPNPVVPGAASQTGPVQVESMSGPFPRMPSEKPGQTRPTQAIPRATTNPGQTGQTQGIPRATNAGQTGQTQTIPVTQTQPIRTTQAIARPAAPLKPPPGMTEADVNALHAKYVKAKEMIGEKVDAGSREKLLKTINQTAPKIMEQYKASGVDFSVVVKDNQVVIKAKPKT